MADIFDTLKRVIPSPKIQKKIITAFVVAAIILFGLNETGIIDLQQIENVPRQYQPETYRLEEVEDGDTIAVRQDGETEQVRLIGVDTPETRHPNKPVQCYGPEASSFTESITKDRVRLVTDPLSDNRDVYGRLLRYVYTPGGTHVNAEIIRQGYGFAYRRFPFEEKQRFIALENTARMNGRGLWSDCQIIKNDRGAPETAPVQ